MLDGEGITWVEEPTQAYNFAGHAEIAREVQTPIQCGENLWGTLDVQHALDARASDYVMLDVMKVGGVTSWLHAGALTHSRGIRVSSQLWPELSAQLLGITPTAHWLKYGDRWNPVIRWCLTVDERGKSLVYMALLPRAGPVGRTDHGGVAM